MKSSSLLCLFLLALILTPAWGVPFFANAQATILRRGLAEFYEVQVPDNGEIFDGAVVRMEGSTLAITNQPQDPYVFGVISLAPALAVNYGAPEGSYPVIRDGSAFVKVNSSNGAITAGDYLTTSSESGVAVKASAPGFVIGIAQADMPEEASEALIPVEIDIIYAADITREDSLSPRAVSRQIQSIFALGTQAVANAPNTFVRYLLAVAVMVTSIGFGFWIFGRAVSNAVAAIGRNPLARTSIFAAITFNITMTLIFVGAGLALGIFILVS